MIYFEDLEVGRVERFGRYAVTREEVLEFAEKYDPQAFHLDDEAAARTPFGRLAASGWHTAAMAMRMTVDNMGERRGTSLGSPGLDELRWIRPVYPGDILRCETQLLEKRRSQSKPFMGIVRNVLRVYNQDDELVMTQTGNVMVRVRNP